MLAAYPTLTVNTTLDEKDGGTLLSPAGPDGLLSLREAITVANLDAGPNSIKFNIPTTDPNYNGQWWTLQVDLYDVTSLSAALPTLTDSGTTIDGFSQTANQGDTNPGVVGSGGTVGVDQAPLPQYQKLEIAIDRNGDEGASAVVDFNPRGLTIGGNASNILIKGMAIYDVGRPLGIADDFDIAIFGEGGSGTNRVVESMLVGVLPDGSDPALERDRGFGVRQDAGGQLTVTKNYVGFNGRGGLDGVSNTSVVTFEYNEVFESGWASGDHDGIDINGLNSIARYNLSRDNTNSTMVIATGGSGSGIELGSQTAGTGGNLVENNTVFGNLSAGISVRAGASLNTIRKNVIFDNQVGVSVNEESRLTHRNQISMNSIYMNFGLGIDLQHRLPGGLLPGQWVGSPDGGNDTELTGQDHLGCDTDAGSNDLQNYPILSSVSAFGGSTTIEGSLISTPNTTFILEFFSTPDGTLFLTSDREGKDFIGAIQVTTDALCTATFRHTFASSVTEDDAITATATKFTGANIPWSTSEFSPAVPVAEITLQEKVTGGGWYNQPVTGIPAPTSGDDRANFGFNAKYKKDNPVPQGVTNFHYHPANLHFLSTSYAELSLIVTDVGPGVQRATWRGLGKLNNASGYGFRADVTDAGEPGTSDTFHIKIWQEFDQDPFTEEPFVVYDNDPTSAGTVLGGGNIQIHMSPNALEASIAGNSDSTRLQPLSDEVLQDAVAQAIAWWRGEGVEEAGLAILADAQVLLGALPDTFLGVAANGVIGIDRDAAGRGWSIDASSAGKFDLATVLIHEFGHLLGFEHKEGGVMESTLAPRAPLLFGSNHLAADVSRPGATAALALLSTATVGQTPVEPALPAESPIATSNIAFAGGATLNLASAAPTDLSPGSDWLAGFHNANPIADAHADASSGAASSPALRWHANATDYAVRLKAMPRVVEFDAEAFDTGFSSAPVSWGESCDACFANEHEHNGEEIGLIDLPVLAMLAAIMAGGWQRALARSKTTRAPERFRLRKGV